MDPNQTQDQNINPMPAADAGMGMPAADPMAGTQTPAEPMMPTPVVTPAEPVAPTMPEPVATPVPEPIAPAVEEPAAPVAEIPVAPTMPEPVAPQGGDMGGEQTPPATPPVV